MSIDPLHSAVSVIICWRRCFSLKAVLVTVVLLIVYSILVIIDFCGDQQICGRTWATPLWKPSGNPKHNGMARMAPIRSQDIVEDAIYSSDLHFYHQAQIPITSWTQRAFVLSRHHLAVVLVIPVASVQNLTSGSCVLASKRGLIVRDWFRRRLIENHGKPYHAFIVRCEFKSAMPSATYLHGQTVYLKFTKSTRYSTNAVNQRIARPSKDPLPRDRLFTLSSWLSPMEVGCRLAGILPNKAQSQTLLCLLGTKSNTTKSTRTRRAGKRCHHH